MPHCTRREPQRRVDLARQLRASPALRVLLRGTATDSYYHPSPNCALLAVDEMGHRIDELENSIGELMAQAGIEEDADLDTTPAPAS